MKFLKWLASTVFTVIITLFTMWTLEMDAAARTAAIQTCFYNAANKHEEKTGQKLHLDDYDIISVSGASSFAPYIDFLDNGGELPRLSCIMRNEYNVKSITAPK